MSTAHAIVRSQIDFCNSLIYGVHDTHMKKLQIVKILLNRLLTCPLGTLASHTYSVSSTGSLSGPASILELTSLYVTLQQPPFSLKYSGSEMFLTTFALSKRSTSSGLNYSPKLWNSLPKSVCCVSLVLAFSLRPSIWITYLNPLNYSLLSIVIAHSRYWSGSSPNKTFRYCVLDLVILFGSTRVWLFKIE